MITNPAGLALPQPLSLTHSTGSLSIYIVLCQLLKKVFTIILYEMSDDRCILCVMMY